MSLIFGSERAHFDWHIVAADLNVDDFEIIEERELPGTPAQRLGTGWLIVLYKPTGIKRHYRGGVFPPPHCKFKRALEMNEFKT